MPNAAPRTRENLKNPGDSVARGVQLETDFTDYPLPDEFLRRGGTPGMTYLYVLSQNIHKAQNAGYGHIFGVPHFTVNGIPMTIMAKGDPDPSAMPGGGRPFYRIDIEAEKATGISFTPTNEAPSARGTNNSNDSA